MKKVLLTQRIDYHDEINETRDALDHRLVQWLTKAGYSPYIAPNTFSINDDFDKTSSNGISLRTWLQDLQPQAIVLSGGNDIGQYPQRDDTECYLLSWAETHRLPVLGICRGLQLMGTWAGVELINVGGHVRTRHHLIHYDNKVNWPDSVNSYHNMALADCPANFNVLACAEDETIEAIRHNQLPWEGWMWHPERETPFAIEDLKRLEKLFNG